MIMVPTTDRRPSGDEGVSEEAQNMVKGVHTFQCDLDKIAKHITGYSVWHLLLLLLLLLRTPIPIQPRGATKRVYYSIVIQREGQRGSSTLHTHIISVMIIIMRISECGLESVCRCFGLVSPSGCGWKTSNMSSLKLMASQIH